MPYYLFSNPDTEEIREIFFHMNDEKVYIDENNLTIEFSAGFSGKAYLN